MEANQKLSDKYKASDNSKNQIQNDGYGGSRTVSNGMGVSYMQRQINKERECCIFLLVGETGVGKSHSIIQLAKGYIKDNPQTGKKGRPFFIFDTNGEEEYAKAFPKVCRYKEVGRIINPDVYRVLPINESGAVMDDEEIRQAMIYLAFHVKKSALALDDIDSYFSGAKPRVLERLFTGIRHRGGRDVIFSHQRLSAIYPQERAGATIISLRHTNESVESIKDRWRNSEIISLAQEIVEEQYELAERMYQQNIIGEDEYKKRRSFFLEIQVRSNRIVGLYSKECFIRNCKKYINLNPNMISRFQKINCDREGKPIYDRQQTIDKIIETRLWKYFAGKE